MALPHESVLSQYRYDPLDRVIGQASAGTPEHQRFYNKNRLATEIKGAVRHSIFQKDDLLLAQQRSGDGAIDTSLLAPDQQRSILQTCKANQQRKSMAYSPYGHRAVENGLLSLLGFNGERQDPVTGHYLLGNGYRAFNPVLMRFNSPDSLSPFGEGGMNSYTYCLGDPVNFSDSSGHNGIFNSILQSLANSYDKSLKAYMTRRGHRIQKPINRRLSDPGSLNQALIEPDFIGYHGTGKKQVKKLLKEGVSLRNIDIKGDKRGFFLSPDVSTTYEYARKHEILETKIATPRDQIYGKENVVEIHIRNLTSMKPGIDYDYNVYRDAHPTKPTSMEFFIANHKSRAIDIRELGSTPESKKVRPRAHEAPF